MIFLLKVGNFRTMNNCRQIYGYLISGEFAIVFPARSTDNFVLIDDLPFEELSAFTISAWLYTEEVPIRSWFSYATVDDANKILLIGYTDGDELVYVAGSSSNEGKSHYGQVLKH